MLLMHEWSDAVIDNMALNMAADAWTWLKLCMCMLLSLAPQHGGSVCRLREHPTRGHPSTRINQLITAHLPYPSGAFPPCLKGKLML